MSDPLDFFRDLAAKLPDELSVTREIIERSLANVGSTPPPVPTEQVFEELRQRLHVLTNAHIQLVDYVLKGR